MDETSSTPDPNRYRFRFGLKWLFLEVLWIALAVGAWILLAHSSPAPGLAVPLIAFYTACGAVIGGLFGRAGWGALTGAILSSLLIRPYEPSC